MSQEPRAKGFAARREPRLRVRRCSAMIGAMTSYVALLRGIGPSNPNMHQSKLCGVVEDLGFADARGVISSGNVVFESDRTDTAQIEADLEAAWPENLGFTSTTVVRSRERLSHLVAADPFGGLEHGRASYLMVTFFKGAPVVDFEFPHQPEGKHFMLRGLTDSALFTVADNTEATTPDLMTWLDRQFTKEITSRTWLTVQRILKKME